MQVETEDAWNFMKGLGNESTSADSTLLMMQFQKHVEQAAFNAGGGNFVAPAQRMVDFAEDRLSSSLPKCSYIPGLQSSQIKNVLPFFITKKLQKAIKSFSKKMPQRYGNSGYYTNEAVLVATESRTSSPVRIPRDEKFLNHPQLKNLYPCGEGAGYAGGIVSAAMDGERIAKAIALV